MRTLLMTLALAPVGLWMIWPLLGVQDGPVSLGLWGLTIVSAIANLFVIYYHYSTPPHPKFVMLPKRRFWILVHIISGLLEYVFGLLVLVLPEQRWPGIAMAVTALFFHVPSSFAQNAIVAGSRIVMIPSYIACSAGHAFSAAMLLAYPTSTLWAVNTFLVFNTYAWVRIYGAAFMALELFAENRYTMMVLAAGLTTMPPVFGVLFPVQLGVFLAIYAVTYRKLYSDDAASYRSIARERDRWALISREAADLWDDRKSSSGQLDKARAVFDHFDHDGDGRWDAEAVKQVLSSWSLPQSTTAALVPAASAGGIDFDAFVHDIWSLGTVRNRATLAVEVSALKSLRDKAQLAFDVLDLDGDGQLSAHELELLLLEWNLPLEETASYIRVADSDGDGRLDFEDFFRRMQPVWEFLFYNVLGPQVASSNLLAPGERLTSRQEDLATTAALLARTKSELVGRVDFLQGASPQLLADVAASLEEHRLAAGELLFDEGDAGERFYILVEGQLQLTRCGDPLCVMDVGASFGEAALLGDGRRTASARAIGPCLLFALTRSSFRFLTERNPEMQASIHAMHKTWREERMRSGLHQALRGPHGLDALLEPDAFDALMARWTDHRLHEGEVIIREGDVADRFYVVHHGSVVVRRDGVEIARLGPGECFGEIAMLTGSTRNATVVAGVDCVLFGLDQASFDQVVAKRPKLAAHLLEVAAARSS
ncbi:MAG: cyclic nucleotide-binding domain-containing protein [Deltaproteobacteria bacterium]|nr:cyclic nucleotide-binding domain-containing protein [Deltaproteobacteria bacterium]